MSETAQYQSGDIANSDGGMPGTQPTNPSRERSTLKKTLLPGLAVAAVLASGLVATQADTAGATQGVPTQGTHAVLGNWAWASFTDWQRGIDAPADPDGQAGDDNLANTLQVGEGWADAHAAAYRQKINDGWQQFTGWQADPNPPAVGEGEEIGHRYEQTVGKPGWTETIIVTDEKAWTETIPAVTHVEHHPAETHTVHHDAVTHVEHHDAVTHVVHHDAVTHQEKVVDSPAVPAIWQNFSPNKDQGPFEGPPSWPTDPRGTWQHEDKELPPGQAGPDGVYQNGSGNGSWFYRQGAVAEVSHMKTVTDTPARDETVIDKAAYDETVTDKAAYDETVTDKAAYDETVTDTPKQVIEHEAVTHEETVEHPGDQHIEYQWDVYAFHHEYRWSVYQRTNTTATTPGHTPTTPETPAAPTDASDDSQTTPAVLGISASVSRHGQQAQHRSTATAVPTVIDAGL